MQKTRFLLSNLESCPENIKLNTRFKTQNTRNRAMHDVIRRGEYTVLCKSIPTNMLFGTKIFCYISIFCYAKH